MQLRLVELGIGALGCFPFLLNRDIHAALFHAYFQQLYLRLERWSKYYFGPPCYSEFHR